MRIPKNYFRDRMVLLLVSSNTFLAVLNSILVLLRLDTSRPDGYIVEYRANLGLSAFKSGGPGVFLGLIAFSLFVLVFHTILSMRVYPIRRHFSIAILSLGLLLLTLSLIVSNALLVLR